MPQYKTHLLGGFIVFIILFILLQSSKIFGNYTFLCLLSALIGSLFPDIDTKSMIQKFIYFFLFIGVGTAIFMQKWQIASFVGVISLIPMIINHRRLTHRIWFIVFMPLAIPIAIFYYNPQLLHPAIASYVFFVGGAISHIWLDFGIRRGIRRFFR